jgi:hypothetical protein
MKKVGQNTQITEKTRIIVAISDAENVTKRKVWSIPVVKRSQKERYKELAKQKTSIPGTIYEVDRFSTWWNNNLATVVSYYNGYYHVFLLVYVKEKDTVKVFPEDKYCNYWGDFEGKRFNEWRSSSAAQFEAEYIKHELNVKGGKYYENPILLIHPLINSYCSFEKIVKEPYVIKKHLLSDLKPFDIVKTYTSYYGIDFYHVGVYLGIFDGEKKVFHFTRDKNDTTIDGWNYFKEGNIEIYHPAIPFKNYQEIAQQMAWAKDNNFRKGQYDLDNRNCEHLANMIIYGINYSEQIENSNLLNARDGINTINSLHLTLTFNLLNPGTGYVRLSKRNNDKVSTIKLTNEMNESDGLLERKSDYETEKYETEYLQEILPKQNCIVM